MTGSARRTFRPTGVIVVLWAMVAVLAVLALVIGARLPEQSKFSTSQTVTIWVLIGGVALAAALVTRSRVTADDTTVEFVNGWRRRRLSWAEVAGVSMNPGAPWPTVVTRDDRRFILFAIQGSDGASAANAVRWLAGHVR